MRNAKTELALTDSLSAEQISRLSEINALIESGRRDWDSDVQLLEELLVLSEYESGVQGADPCPYHTQLRTEREL